MGRCEEVLEAGWQITLEQPDSVTGQADQLFLGCMELSNWCYGQSQTSHSPTLLFQDLAGKDIPQDAQVPQEEEG